jgi:hypothetical protein
MRSAAAAAAADSPFSDHGASRALAVGAGRRASGISRAIGDTRHTSHVTRHTSHVTRHTSHVTRHTSHVTRDRFTSSWIRQCLGTGKAVPPPPGYNDHVTR